MPALTELITYFLFPVTLPSSLLDPGQATVACKRQNSTRLCCERQRRSHRSTHSEDTQAAGSSTRLSVDLTENEPLVRKTGCHANSSAPAVAHSESSPRSIYLVWGLGSRRPSPNLIHNTGCAPEQEMQTHTLAGPGNHVQE